MTVIKISNDLKKYCIDHLYNDCATCEIRQDCHTPCRMSIDALNAKTEKMNKLIGDMKKSALHA